MRPDCDIEPAQGRASVRSWSLRLALAALGIMAAASFTVAQIHGTAAPLPQAIAADGAAQLVNSSSGSAILSGLRMLPGQSVTGTVTIANQGTASGRLELTTAALADTPGPGGGQLSERLQLVVRDDTAGALRYEGTLAGLQDLALGTFRPHEAHRYRFTVGFPAQTGDNAYQSSSVSVTYNWQAETS
jgi:hypothetical protein